ncbi:hypothetical protein PMAYCL1PPCAC_09472 [Pristionchus mayeri]|uniref:Uncharacterized protein n=1 Tax=Pristionchus mayeri TaxID=1317129 RepID=A0AAN4ZDM7_9BILA|nr:hypothetical protein PMAYCL1PPCAC_09472 [Pristionchus mayeri]
MTSVSCKIQLNNVNVFQIRERLGGYGIPEGAIDEFIAGEFYEHPFKDEKLDRVMEWFKKWDISKEHYALYLRSALKRKFRALIAASPLREESP